MNLIADILKRIHRKLAKDTDYPDSGDEDLLVRLDYIDDAINEYEDSAKEGYAFKELKTSEPFTFNGTGSDDLPETFLAFIRRFDFRSGGFQKAVLQIGSARYQEVTAAEGSAMEQSGAYHNVFWQEGNKLRTLPAANGTFNFPFLKKHTRYVTGTETTEPEMEKPKFIEHYALAQVFNDNSDDDQYRYYLTSAAEKLKAMRYNALA